MPISVPDAVREQAIAGEKKTDELRMPLAYGINTLFGGAYVGVAVVLMFAAAGPLEAAQSPFSKLAQGLLFGIALTLVVFAGAELSTGNMMVSVMGLFDRLRGPGIGGVAAIIAVSFVGNLVGAIVFSLLVHGSGVLELVSAPGSPPPGAAMLESVATKKVTEGVDTMLLRGILCNMLVTLGVWMAARTRSDAAKLLLLLWVLLAFIATGFDHVVANMTIMTLGLLAGVPAVTVASFAWNLLWVGLGNLIGGAVIGAAYGYLGRAHTDDAPRDDAGTAGASDDAARPVAQA
ncbi:formate/nitrite transporter family protein [Actinomycetospora corticicola]|uniref:Nitrite transporter NirC n=1 Tax=Actinomycetospora corticicola TaxID=663602 RepID=A0A7Y9DXW2_9PSEU|nr:formate/nitrite transporter family protein [Actinomycetospora corticicola]NYD37217.1 nitrite transporter NirC [Actinomycetospora corticicola]